MSNFIELTTGAGVRQRLLLLELHSQAIICLNGETGLWERGGLATKYAKDLLLKSDKTVEEKITDLEPYVLRNEKEAQRLGVKLSGAARNKLDALYKIRENVYV